MKFITLNNGTRIRVSDEDLARVSSYSWSQFRNGRAYRKELIPREVRARKTYRTLLLHREIMGVDDARKVIFRDGDPSNCTRDNLVVMDPTFQPRQRVKKGGSSEYRGVGWNRAKGMWQAFIRVNGKLKHLGFFEPGEEGEREAARAYDTAALEQFGELAHLNFQAETAARPAASKRRAASVAASAKPRLVAEPPRTEEARAEPAPPAAKSGPEDLYEKPVHELTPEEMEAMKARFLGERYRGRIRRAG
jgi:hypothetical protein